jgi:hypothetical protein
MGVLLLSLLSCEQDGDLRQALKLADDNRPELEKVLAHYKKNQADSLKYKAACFLIKNMSRHFTYDTTNLHLYRPILAEWPNLEINTLQVKWNILKQHYPLNTYIYQNASYDIHQITTQYLINEIDGAFHVWYGHPHKDSISFDNFCEYVLPYKKYKGLAIYDWRSLLRQKLIKHLSNNFIITTVDTLLSQYRDYKHSTFILPDYPYLRHEDMLLSGRSLCLERCWFNTMLLSSVGIPSTIDYVPAWANRPFNHTWNTIQYGNTFYAFEPFWDDDRWKYKTIYNNVNKDPLWGLFKLPKVFRYTYATQKSGPLFEQEDIKNIPSFFQTLNQKDVSNEYFETQDVDIAITCHHPKEFAYLCVYDEDKEWMPVQWGKYENRKVHFEKMGTDIMYLPAFYQSGRMISGASPFILYPGGNIKTLYPENENTMIVVKRINFVNNVVVTVRKSLSGGQIQGANKQDFSDFHTLVTIRPEDISTIMSFTINDVGKYRYFRYYFPDWATIRKNDPDFPYPINGHIAELTLWDENNNKISGTTIYSDNINKHDANNIFDNNLFTEIRLLDPIYEHENIERWIGLQSSQPKRVSMIEFIPRNDGEYIYRGLHYELFYWDNKWVSVGIQKADSATIVFRAPKNALYQVKCIDKKLHTRPFTYENGVQIWW